ncbi:MAG TPA: hypothetical protein VJ179_00270 [Patescibacteria group bacterium]|nr:hypothetical protein [Patescibacteria group bacterium]
MIGSVIEAMCRTVQLHYMRKRKTREIVGTHMALFHPKDWTPIVKEEYQKRLHAFHVKPFFTEAVERDQSEEV